jgi:peptide/nickel transport system permease protein
MVRYLLRRLAQGALVVLAVAAAAFWLPRVLRPDLYASGPALAGTVHDLRQAFLHFDFGQACSLPGCPPVRVLWTRGYAADLWLLAGALALGVAGGVAGGAWCASHAGSRRARALETIATVLYCTPVYVVGMALLLLFNPLFGLIPVPAFFDAAPQWASPVSDPWLWLRTFAVPWLVLAAPLGAMCLRLTVGLLREEVDADHVRTAIAKGVSRRRVVTRHALPGTSVATASLVGVSVPLLVTNMVLVEKLFSVPGFFLRTWKATGHTSSPIDELQRDFPTLQGISIWAAVLIVLVGLLADLAIAQLDPRIRSSGRALG